MSSIICMCVYIYKMCIACTGTSFRLWFGGDTSQEQQPPPPPLFPLLPRRRGRSSAGTAWRKAESRSADVLSWGTELILACWYLHKVEAPGDFLRVCFDSIESVEVGGVIKHVKQKVGRSGLSGNFCASWYAEQPGRPSLNFKLSLQPQAR